jgi:hypothetical protein
MTYVPPPMPEPVSIVREENNFEKCDIQSSVSFDYSINEPLIEDID